MFLCPWVALNSGWLWLSPWAAHRRFPTALPAYDSETSYRWVRLRRPADSLPGITAGSSPEHPCTGPKKDKPNWYISTPVPSPYLIWYQVP